MANGRLSESFTNCSAGQYPFHAKCLILLFFLRAGTAFAIHYVTQLNTTGSGTMKRFLLGLTFALLAAPPLASATLISFQPTATTVGIGGNVAIDIVATPEAGELIGEFDFNVIYDPGVLLFDGAVFGPSLNDDPFLCAIALCRGAADVGGAVNLFELSLVFPLTTLQDGATPIVLATLVFDAIGAGTSNLGIVGNILGRSAPFNILGDDFGIALPVFEPGTGTVTVVDIAEPPGPLLLLTGLLMLAACRRRRNVAPT